MWACNSHKHFSPRLDFFLYSFTKICWAPTMYQILFLLVFSASKKNRVPRRSHILLLGGGGEPGETENKLIIKQVLWKAVKQVIGGEDAGEGGFITLFKGDYIQWSRKAPLISDISATSAGRCGSEGCRQKGRSKCKVPVAGFCLAFQGIATRSHGWGNKGENSRKWDQRCRQRPDHVGPCKLQ